MGSSWHVNKDNLTPYFRKYICLPFQIKQLIQDIKSKWLSDCLWQFQTQTLNGSTTVLYNNFTDQKILETYWINLITVKLFACFQPHPKMNCTTEKKSGDQICQKIAGDPHLHIHSSTVRSEQWSGRKKGAYHVGCLLRASTQLTDHIARCRSARAGRFTLRRHSAKQQVGSLISRAHALASLSNKMSSGRAELRRQSDRRTGVPPKCVLTTSIKALSHHTQTRLITGRLQPRSSFLASNMCRSAICQFLPVDNVATFYLLLFFYFTHDQREYQV